MKLKELKKEIISKGGKIIDKKRFIYKDNEYALSGMIKDSKQWTPFSNGRGEYYNNLKELGEYEIVDKKYYKRDYNFDIVSSTSTFFFIFTFFWNVFKSIFYGFIIKITFNNFSKKYTEDFEERINNLKKGSDVYQKRFANEIDSKNKKLYGSFKKIMVFDYALKNEKEVLPSLDKYISLKEIYKNELKGKVKKEDKNLKSKSLIWFFIIISLIIAAGISYFIIEKIY